MLMTKEETGGQERERRKGNRCHAFCFATSACLIAVVFLPAQIGMALTYQFKYLDEIGAELERDGLAFVSNGT